MFSKKNFVQIFAAFILAVAFSFSTQNPVEAGRQDFTVYNQTGRTIYYLYCSHSGAGTWEEDILHNDTLANGRSLTIRFNSGESARYWDLRVVFSDGSDWYWNNIDLFTVSSVTIDRNGRAHYN